MEARARADRRAAELREAVDARRIAVLDLDALKRGRLDTLTVIADFELVTRLDQGQSNDWLELARLCRDAGRLAQADAMKAVGENVQQEAADEFAGVEGHELAAGFAIGAVVFVFEAGALHPP